MQSDFTDQSGEKQGKARASRRTSQKSLRIERNVPLPGLRSPASQAILDAMARCERGDSFVIPIEEGVSRSSVMMSITRNKKSLPEMKFTLRSADGGVRVWRVE